MSYTKVGQYRETFEDNYINGKRLLKLKSTQLPQVAVVSPKEHDDQPAFSRERMLASARIECAALILCVVCRPFNLWRFCLLTS